MSVTDEQSRALLQEAERSDYKEAQQSKKHQYASHETSSWCRGSLVLLSTLSVLANILLASALYLSYQQQIDMRGTALNSQYVEKSPYAELGLEPSFRYPYSSGYGPQEVTNHSLADEMWEAIDINPGIVAVPLDWAEDQNLAETQPFPWDPSKGLYVISAFHTVHCLKILHRIVYEAHHGWPLSREPEHALHCIDHMRKDAMCAADDFLLPTPPHRQGNEGPRGQNRVCRNWDALVKWANDRNACYDHITDDEVAFAQNHREIERYMDCPPGSPYAERKERYLRLKGEALSEALDSVIE